MGKKGKPEKNGPKSKASKTKGKAGKNAKATAGGDDKPKRKARGHRQKGGGSIVVSKGPVVNRGVEMKEWQRTPQQLLQEYTQAQKRPKPIYKRVAARKGRPQAAAAAAAEAAAGGGGGGGGLTFRVVLRDTKKPGTDRDLVFTPQEAFASETEAKHGAALLALFQLTPERPHEMKLPDPYRALWINMTRRAGGTVAKAATALGTGSKSKASKTAAGPAAGAASKKPAASLADRWGGDDSDSDDNAKAAGTARPAKAKAAQKAQVEDTAALPTLLTATHKHASRAGAARDQAARKLRQAQRENKKSVRELKQSANRPPLLVLQPAAQALVSQALAEQARFDAARRASAGEGEDGDEEEGEGAAGLDKPVAEVLPDWMTSRLKQHLKSQGFSKSQRAELFALPTKNWLSDDWDRSDMEALGELAVDWLVLHLPAEELPAQFDPSAGQWSLLTAAGAEVEGAGEEASWGKVAAAALQRSGLRRADAAQAVRASAGGSAVGGVGPALQGAGLRWVAAAAAQRQLLATAAATAAAAAADAAASSFDRSVLAGALARVTGPASLGACLAAACSNRSDSAAGVDDGDEGAAGGSAALPGLAWSEEPCTEAGVELEGLAAFFHEPGALAIEHRRAAGPGASGICFLRRALRFKIDLSRAVGGADTQEGKSKKKAKRKQKQEGPEAVEPLGIEVSYLTAATPDMARRLQQRGSTPAADDAAASLRAEAAEQADQLLDEEDRSKLYPNALPVVHIEGGGLPGRQRLLLSVRALCGMQRLGAESGVALPDLAAAAEMIKTAAVQWAKRAGGYHSDGDVPMLERLRSALYPAPAPATTACAAAAAAAGAGVPASAAASPPQPPTRDANGQQQRGKDKDRSSKGGKRESKRSRLRRGRFVRGSAVAHAKRSEALAAGSAAAREAAGWESVARQRSRLPITSFKQRVVDAVRGNRVTLLAGATGCGKTTQVPQFLLEDAIDRGEGGQTRIVCTQPRRIAAVSVAERVADERCQGIGSKANTVGYHIRGERNCDHETSLVFCTVGILLRQLQGEAEEAKRAGDDGGKASRRLDREATAAAGYTHIIVDEVHERGIDTDFLLTVLRDLVARRPHIRVLLMSATMDAASFAGYFAPESAKPSRKASNGAAGSGGGALAPRGLPKAVPVLEVPGFVHPVREVYADEILRMAGGLARAPKGMLRRREEEEEEEDGDEEAEMSDPAEGDDEADDAAAAAGGKGGRGPLALCPQQWRKQREVDPRLVAGVLASIASGRCPPPPPPAAGRAPSRSVSFEEGTILCFLSGVPSISAVGMQLQSVARSAGLRVASNGAQQQDDARPAAQRGAGHRRGDGPLGLQILPLHGQLTPQEQRRVFRPALPGFRKVVLSTNIAETSLTIDDVTVVVDSARVKEQRFDATNHMSRLVEDWASVAAMDQRRGRAGRVRPGVCVRLVPEPMMATLRRQPQPEIQRTCLEQFCLRVKALGLGSANRFLQSCLDPPVGNHIDTALRQLVELGALDPLQDPPAGIDPNDGELTALGTLLSRMPVDVRLGKLALFGCLLHCSSAALTLAASMAQRSPFRAPASKRAQAAAKHAAFATGESDHLALVKLYSDWRAMCAANPSQRARRDWCGANFLSYNTLKTIDTARIDFAAVLADAGFLPGRRPAGVAVEGYGAFGEESAALNEHGSSSRVVESAVVASMGGKIVKVVYPDLQFTTTMGSSVQKEFEARRLRFYTRVPDAEVANIASSQIRGPVSKAEGDAAMATGAGQLSTKYLRRNGNVQLRVNLHPGSFNGGRGQFETRYLVYHELAETRRVFVRDSGTVPLYALPLLGPGPVKIRRTEGGEELLTVGEGNDWISFRANRRISLLVQQLRRGVDELLAAKVEDPELRVERAPVLAAALTLLKTSGFGAGAGQ